jgi:hypothetical protein
MAMPSPATQTHREVLAGIVEWVTFYSVETGFCVLRVKARRHRDLATIVGHAATISAGEWITARPIWLSRNWVFRANWRRGLRAHSGHPTGSTSTSEQAVRALRFSGLSSQIRIG